MTQLKLTYPSIQAGQEFMLDTAPSAVSAWHEHLAFSDIDRAIHELLNVAKTLNRCQQKTTHREANFLTLNKGYLQISKHLREHNDRRTIKVTHNQLKSLHALSTEMAFAYKRIVDELSAQKFALKKSQRLAQAINYSQHYLGIMLIEHYQLHTPVPAYLWHELHMLYEFAQDLKLHRAKTNSSDEALEPMPTIEETYIRSCLLAIIDPYHLGDNLHWHLFKYFYHWANKAILDKNLQHFSESRCFIINLSEGKKPLFIQKETEYEDSGHLRLLLTDKLLEVVEQHMLTLEESQELPKPGFYKAIDNKLAMKLLHRIFTYCDQHLKRQSTRYPMMGHVSIVWGANAIQKTLSSLEKLTINEHLGHQIKDLLGDDYKTGINWQTVNYSEGGMCIRHNKQQVAQLAVGSIALIRLDNNHEQSNRWQLAISRWQNIDHARGTTVGVEYLKGNPELNYYLTKTKEDEIIKHPVITLKQNDSFPSVMIAPKSLIGGQKLLQLEVYGKHYPSYVTHIIESSSQLAIFGIRRD